MRLFFNCDQNTWHCFLSTESSTFDTPSFSYLKILIFHRGLSHSVSKVGPTHQITLSTNPVGSRLVSKTIESAQSRVEGFNFDIRKRVVEFDDVIDERRETIYAERDKVLHNEDLTDTVRAFLDEDLEALLDQHCGSEHPDDWGMEGLSMALHAMGVDGEGTRRGRALGGRRPRGAGRAPARAGRCPAGGEGSRHRRDRVGDGGAPGAPAHDRLPLGGAPHRARRHAAGHRPPRLRAAGSAQRVQEGGLQPLLPAPLRGPRSKDATEGEQAGLESRRRSRSAAGENAYGPLRRRARRPPPRPGSAPYDAADAPPHRPSPSSWTSSPRVADDVVDDRARLRATSASTPTAASGARAASTSTRPTRPSASPTSRPGSSSRARTSARRPRTRRPRRASSRPGSSSGRSARKRKLAASRGSTSRRAGATRFAATSCTPTRWSRTTAPRTRPPTRPRCSTASWTASCRPNGAGGHRGAVGRRRRGRVTERRDGLVLRAAREDELPACADVWRAGLDGYGARVGRPAMISAPGPLVALLAHLRRADPERFLVVVRSGADGAGASWHSRRRVVANMSGSSGCSSSTLTNRPAASAGRSSTPFFRPTTIPLPQRPAPTRPSRSPTPSMPATASCPAFPRQLVGRPDRAAPPSLPGDVRSVPFELLGGRPDRRARAAPAGRGARGAGPGDARLRPSAGPRLPARDWAPGPPVRSGGRAGRRLWVRLACRADRAAGRGGCGAPPRRPGAPPAVRRAAGGLLGLGAGRGR